MDWSQVFSIGLYHGYIPQILIAEAIYTLKLRRRPHFWLRLAIGLPVCVFLSIVLPNMIAMVVSGFFSMTIFALSLLLCIFLFENRFSDILFCCINAQFTQNLSYNLENVFYLPFAEHIDTVGWFMISVSSMTIVYLVGFCIFMKRMREGAEIKIGKGYVFSMAIANVLFVYVMHYLLQVYEIDKLWITHLPLIICCIFGLGMQYGLLAYKDEQAENAQLEYFLRQGNKQYEMTKNSIDLINMKAHDLKHYIRRVQEMHEYDHDELQEIAEVVGEYEKTVNCGNKTLDVVLTDKQYQCKEYSISLSLIVQGEELSFMRDSDLCSIFSNALDNAIECERKIEKESNRCIALKVFRKGDIVCIHIENYCEQFPEMQDGLPLTSKEDKTSHGFGMKSIRYIVEKYQGSMQIGGGANLFVLNILIPVPCK